jgi:hypothetical protein
VWAADDARIGLRQHLRGGESMAMTVSMAGRIVR